MLAERLREYAGRDDVIVLGLPRGGVPVASEIARALGAPLDVFVVRKLGVPGHEELALGAIASGGARVVNRRLVEALAIPADHLAAIEAKQSRELVRRERDYRGERPPPDLARRTVILVDDGLATGSTMLAAIRAVLQEHPARVVVAVPVAPQDVGAALGHKADEMICLLTPADFQAVGSWYDDFSQTSDAEVRALLGRARQPPRAALPSTIRELTGAANDYDPLVERAVATSVALIGEASHGTHEFYRERAEITKRLIAEAGYTAVAVEADWPDAYRVNCYVRGAGEDPGPVEALSDFRRFPAWKWRNRDVTEFITWLREWNDALPSGAPKVGFYGLDLYSMHASMEAVVEFLEQVDPAAAERARERFACFDHFSRDPQISGYETGPGSAEPCERQAVEQLVELQRRRAELAGSDGRVSEDRYFYAEQNARLVANAEQYYGAAFRGGIESWNLRDLHMAETLEALVDHLGRTHGPPKAVVWEHNSHVGDARATELGQAGELNVGQLVRERHGADAVLVGFTTFTGTVTAASEWGGPAERKHVRPALAGSWEELLHERGVARFLLEPAAMGGRRLERAIGVIYRPETERHSHYFHARLALQFDAVIHIDETRALEPLERTSQWEQGELPETFPWGV
jgi:erythromycin esterase-like protein/adenine/guanine phosphoribosyltransferase-like PRPP-binding protein